MALPRASNLRLALSLPRWRSPWWFPPRQRSPAGEADQRAQEEFFEAKVRPVIANRCLDCHGSEKSKGGLRLDSRDAVLKGAESGPVVLPGKPDESPLIAAIRYEGDVQMPPKGKLKDAEIAALTEWVKRGAFWPAARPSAATGARRLRLRDRPPPLSLPPSSITRSAAVILVVPAGDEPSTAGGARTWHGQLRRSTGSSSPSSRRTTWRPAPAADKPTLIRRAYFDLDRTTPLARARSPRSLMTILRTPSHRVVDRLLASPHYGERWGRYWLDVARYGEDQAHSFQPRLYPNGYRYRDWVVRALNRDIPYDRFVLEQIAGDLIEGPRPRPSVSRPWASSLADRSITETPSGTTSTPTGSTR